MKKILLSSLAVVAGFVATAQLPVSTTAENKNAILEEFTGIGCTWCPAGHKLSDELEAANPGNYFAINYHVSGYANPQGPGTDFRTVDGTAIDVAGAPSGYPNGGVNRGTAAGWSTGRGDWTGMVAPIVAAASPANVALEGQVDYATRVLTVDVEVTYPTGGPAASGADDFLSVALIQNNIEGPQTGMDKYPAAILPNGNYNHQHVFRMFVNTTHPNGDAINTAQGVVVTKQYVVTLPNDIAGTDMNLGQLHLVAFLTEDNNLTSPIITGAGGDVELILPAGVSLADMSAAATHTAPSTLCDNAFTPKITVTNASTTSIAQYTVSYAINGGASVSQDVTTALAASGSFEYVFPAITLGNGTSQIVYSSNTDNDATTIDLMASNNSAIANVYVVPSATIGSTFSANFDSDANGAVETANTTHVNPQGNAAYVTTASGHSGANSFLFDYYSIASGNESSLVLHKLDFSSTTNNGLSFYKAHAQYQTEADELKVDVSTDCGTTWTNAWVKSGADLSTVPAATAGFVATSGQYEQVVIDLTTYDGEAEVMIRFKGKSAYGNRLFIDDINVNSTLLSVDENELVSNLSVYPNPATVNANVVFNLTEVSNVVVNVTNTLGQTVYTENLNNVNGNQNLEINTSNLEAGLYLVNVTVNGNVITKKITVSK